MTATDDTDERDRRRGRCTGLPECCIEFFVGPWQRAYLTRFEDSGAQAFIDAHRQLMHEHARRVYYVPCPKCIAAKTYVLPNKCVRATCVCGQAARKRR